MFDNSFYFDKKRECGTPSCEPRSSKAYTASN